MDDPTGNLVNAALALLGIAASLFLAFNARSGARHRVENLKAAGDAREKVDDPSARTMIDRFIARETVRLEDLLHPDTVAARRYWSWSALTYLLAFAVGVLDFFGLLQEGDLPVALVVLGGICLTFFVLGALRSHKVSQRRAFHRAALEAPFLEDDRQRGAAKRQGDPD